MKRLLVIACFIALALSSLSANDQRARVLMQAAEAKAKVEGDLNAAIKLYKDAEKEAGSNRTLVAQALVRMAECYRQLGDVEARRIYERLVKDYNDQPEAAATARLRLQALAPERSRSGESARRIVPIWTGEGVGYGRPSLDGRYIPFQWGSTGDLAIHDVVINTTRRLTNTGGWVASGDYASDPVISPNNRHVAYTWFIASDGMTELRVLSVDGEGAPRTLLRTRERYLQPIAWTPGGDRIVALRRILDAWQLGIVTVSDGAYQSLKSLEWRNPSTGISLSSDGRYLAYQAPFPDRNSARNIFVLALDGSGENLSVSGPADDVSPLWSADGSHLVFVREEAGGKNLWAMRMREGKPAAEPVLVKSDIGRMEPLGVTRTGSLYYALAGDQRQDVYLAPLDNFVATTPVLVGGQSFDGRTGPAWSPNGDLLTYWSKSAQPAIVLRSMKNGQERTIALPPGTLTNQTSPKWFPDGRTLLIAVRAREGNGLVFSRFDVETGNLQPLHQSATGGVFAVSPDGSAIYWLAQGTNAAASAAAGRLMRFDLKTREEKELKRDEWILAIAVSPDGKELAYLRNVRDAKDRTEAPGFLEVISSQGGETRQVLRDPVWYGPSRVNTLAWTPDQKSLLAVRDDGMLWRFPLNGGAPQAMGISGTPSDFAPGKSTPSPATEGRVKSPAIHPDGKRLAFARAEIKNREIWSLENFLPTSQK